MRKEWRGEEEKKSVQSPGKDEERATKKRVGERGGQKEGTGEESRLCLKNSWQHHIQLSKETKMAAILPGGEVAFQVAGQKEGDLIGLEAHPVSRPDLQHPPAGAQQGVVEVAVGIARGLQHALLQSDRLQRGVPVHGGGGQL